MTPITGSPSRHSAISAPNSGRPVTKDFVPSMGSRTQTWLASGRSLPHSSPMIPWSGHSARMISRMTRSDSRSAIVTGEASDFVSVSGSLRK